MRNRYSKKLLPWLGFSLGWFCAGTALGKSDEKASATDAERTSEVAAGSKPADANGEARRGTSGERTSNSTSELQSTPSSGIPLSLALLGSFGVNSEHTRGGLGARAGVHLEGVLPYYVGGLATYFFGLQESSKDPFGTGNSSVKRTFMYLSAEAGLELVVIPNLTIRPYFGLGIGRAYEETCADSRGCLDKSQYPVTLSPAVLGLYELGSGFFAGADVRFLIAAGASQVSGPVLSGTVGMKF